jgi:hypothetical protein
MSESLLRVIPKVVHHRGIHVFNSDFVVGESSDAPAGILVRMRNEMDDFLFPSLMQVGPIYLGRWCLLLLLKVSILERIEVIISCCRVYIILISH